MKPSAASVVPALADRRHFWAFAGGCLAVTLGVALHLPMFWMGRGNGFRLVDMPVDAEMIWGMVLIVAGIAVAGYGLLPRRPGAGAAEPRVTVSAPEDAPLGRRTGA
jgi:putative MFS transporter